MDSLCKTEFLRTLELPDDLCLNQSTKISKNGFKFDPNDSRGGISATSTKVRPMNPDAIKRSTGALGADYYVDIDTRNKNVELKGMTKGGIPDWKIKDDVSPMDIVKSGKVCK